MITDKKNLVIAILCCCLGIAVFSLIYLFANGGPVEQTTGNRPQATAENPKAENPPVPAQVSHVETLPSTVSEKPVPQFEWKEQRKETFVLDPGHGSIFGPVTSSCLQELCPHLIRWDIKAAAPVDAGALDSNLVDGSDAVSTLLGSPITLCYTPKTLQSQHTCRLTGITQNGYIVVRDSRNTSPIATVGALAAGLMGTREPLRQATRENRVTLTVYQWKCVRFCN